MGHGKEGGRRGWFREVCAKEMEVIWSRGIVDAQGSLLYMNLNENEVPKRNQIHWGKVAERIVPEVN